MLVRKPSTLICAVNSIHSLPPSSPAKSSTSSIGDHSRQRPLGTRHRKGQYLGRIQYATIASEPPNEPQSYRHEEHPWPEPPVGRSCPTPYQILDLKRNAAYTKARYYELVKVYHPDRGSLNPQTLSEQIKTERYRLIVTAHAILSDPGKRSAYDRFGSGWDGKAELGQPQDRTWAQGHQPGPFSHSWSDPSNTIWRNATWEDWERWRAQYNDGQRQPQAPVYFKNVYFIALVGLISILGSSVNYKRGQDAGTYYVEQRDLVHDRTAKDLRMVKEDVTLRGRDERLDWFLRNREASISQFGEAGIEKLRDEKATKLLPDKEICRSEEVAESGV